MTRLLAGLGNPGRDHALDRHNLGFRVLDALAARAGLRFRRSGWRAAAASGQIGGCPVVLLKPTTFMNDSGRSVRAAMLGLGLAPPDLLVVHDELDLANGVVRLREGGSAGGHNGVRSLIASLQSSDFPRLRLGVGRPDAGAIDDYLLSPVPPAERAAEDALIAAAADAVEQYLERSTA